MLIECFNIESQEGSLGSDYFLNHPVIKKLLGRGPECKCGVRLGNSLRDDGGLYCCGASAHGEKYSDLECIWS